MAAIKTFSPDAKTSLLNKPSNGLAKLSTAALALPGMAAQAGENGYLIEETTARYHHATYTEPDGRMEITVDQVYAEFPINGYLDGSVTLIRDVSTGASPVINFRELNGEPYQILEAGASIEDTRDSFESSLNYYGDNLDANLKLGTSTEDDYKSKYASMNFTQYFNQKNTTVNFALGYNTDDVWNVYDPAVLLLEPTEFNKRRKRDYLVGFSQLLDQNSLVQFNLTYSHSFGSLSDPYKKSQVADEGLIDAIPSQLGLESLLNVLNGSGFSEVFNNVILDLLDESFGELVNDEIDIVYLMRELTGAIKDNRPDDRRQLISVLGYSRYFPGTNSALHADYRYVDDNWGTYSHTINTTWRKRLNDDWIVSPGIRYYTQHSAHFYDVLFDTIPDDGYISSDYRLAGYGTLSYKLELRYRATDKVNFYVNAERYYRKHALEFNGSSKGHPIDDYTNSVFSISVDGVLF